MELSDQEYIAGLLAEPLYVITARLAPVMVVYGMFVLATCIAVWPMMISSAEKPKIWLLVGLILVFISFTWTIIVTAMMGGLSTVNIGCNMEDAAAGLISPCVNAFDIKLRFMPWMDDTEAIPVTIMVRELLLVSDTIVVWRAWILLFHNRFWRNTLVLLEIINTIGNILDCIEYPIYNTMALNGFKIDSTWGILIMDYSGVLDLVSFLTSLLVNVAATVLIGWKAWMHHKSLTEAAIYRRTYAIKILLVLVESGAFFCTVQFIYIVVFLTSGGGTWRGVGRGLDVKLPSEGLAVVFDPWGSIAPNMMTFASTFKLQDSPLTQGMKIMIHELNQWRATQKEEFELRTYGVSGRI
ncbi:hypothetical protein BDP27DRAFT_1372524 [Rhodocollybia butyracea]|uniref:Uncharacterized protein n=1 Tax=Rhodocollybia butyracea TaxID=206335 RepID=A0A9P5TXT4_9AGAR|nr:hypothetical protein BDP27DRAFT_1372524 [Rhodocollybia butyracea]